MHTYQGDARRRSKIGKALTSNNQLVYVVFLPQICLNHMHTANFGAAFLIPTSDVLAGDFLP